MATANEQLIIEASIRDEMTSQIQALTRAIQDFASVAKTQVDAANKVVEKLPKSFDKVGQTVEVSTNKAREGFAKAEQAAYDFSIKSTRNLGILDKRIASIGKAAVGLFAVDTVAKVAGFNSAMDLLSKTSEGLVSSLRGVVDSVREGLVPGSVTAAAAVKELREQIEKLKEAQGPTLSGTRFGPQSYGSTISRLGTDITALEAAAKAIEQAQTNIAKLTQTGIFGSLKYPTLNAKQFTELTGLAAPATGANGVIDQTSAQAAVVNDLNRALKALVETHDKEAAAAKAAADAEKEWQERLKKGSEDARFFAARDADRYRQGRFAQTLLPFVTGLARVQQNVYDFQNARGVGGGVPFNPFPAIGRGLNAFGSTLSGYLLNGSGVPSDYAARTKGGGSGLIGAFLPQIRQGIEAIASTVVDAFKGSQALVKERLRNEYLRDFSASFAQSLSYTLEEAIARDDFSKVGRALTKQLEIAFIRGLVLDPFTNAVQGAAQGIFRSFGFGNFVSQATGGVWRGGINSFASGGVAYGPQLAMIGDNPARTEAIVPMPNGRSIPVEMRGGAGGSTVNINISALDGASVLAIMPQIEARLAAAIGGGNQQLRQAVRSA